MSETLVLVFDGEAVTLADLYAELEHFGRVTLHERLLTVELPGAACFLALMGEESADEVFDADWDGVAVSAERTMVSLDHRDPAAAVAVVAALARAHSILVDTNYGVVVPAPQLTLERLAVITARAGA